MVLRVHCGWYVIINSQTKSGNRFESDFLDSLPSLSLSLSLLSFSYVGHFSWWIYVFRAEVLSWRQFCCFQRTLVSVWKHFWCVTVWECYWHLVSEGQWCCETSYNAQNGPSQQRIVFVVSSAKVENLWFLTRPHLIITGFEVSFPMKREHSIMKCMKSSDNTL